MMLTTKGRYAVMAILELASLSPNGPAKLLKLAEAQNIPINYLEQIFAKLKKAGLINSVRGPGGGYILNIVPQKIKIADIINAVDENLEMSVCVLKNQTSCILKKTKKCKTHYLWQGLTHHIKNYFENITLQDVILGNKDFMVL